MADIIEGLYIVKAAKFLAAGLCMAFGGIGSALGQGYIGGKSCESIAKNPEQANAIRQNAMISVFVVETSTIFAFLISLMLIFL